MKIKSAIFALSAISAILAAPVSLLGGIAAKESTEQHAAYHEITTTELKQAIADKKPAIILDARKKITVGYLPGAKQLAYDADAETIAKVLGKLPKDAMIVVYCANKDCPVSGYLAETLVSAGYTNVYKYPAGIAGWLKKNNPIDKI